MRSSFTSAVVLLANLVAAQSPAVEVVTVTKATVALFGLGNYKYPIWASVVAAEPTATTYSLGSPYDQSDSYYDYNYGPTYFVTAGPSTFHYEFSSTYYKSTYYITSGCALTSSAAGECKYTQNIVYKASTRSQQTTANFDSRQYSSALQVITITAGAISPATAANAAATSTPYASPIISSLFTATPLPTLNTPGSAERPLSNSSISTRSQSSTRSGLSTSSPAPTQAVNGAGSLQVPFATILAGCMLLVGVFSSM